MNPSFSHRRSFNRKRRIRQNSDAAELALLAKRLKYGGNPAHKRNPGDFGLDPPSRPMPRKTLCDDAGIFTRKEALRMLRLGAVKGLISEQRRGEFPQNIWAVTDSGDPLEAQLENQEKGEYHGYPVPKGDPFRSEILTRWCIQ